LPFLLAIVAEQNPASCLCQQSPYCKISIHPDIRGVLTNITVVECDERFLSQPLGKFDFMQQSCCGTASST
jgi:hypothetical protein